MTTLATAEITAIYISPGHDFKNRAGKERLNHPVSRVDAVRCVAGKGLEGDRYFDFEDGYKGQATLMDADVVEEVKAHFGLPDLDPFAFRRNILIRGADLNGLIGRRFQLGDLTVFGTEEAAPCRWMDETIAPGAMKFLNGRGGLRIKFLDTGILQTGEIAITPAS